MIKSKKYIQATSLVLAIGLAGTMTVAWAANDSQNNKEQRLKKLIRRCDSPENAEYKAIIKNKQQELAAVPSGQADTEQKRMAIIDDIINQDGKQKCTYE